MMLGLRTAIYHVPDLPRAKAWYAKAFGVAPYFDEPFYVGFNIGGYELGLDPDTSTVGPGARGVVAYWGWPTCRSRSTISPSSVRHCSRPYTTWVTASASRRLRIPSGIRSA